VCIAIAIVIFISHSVGLCCENVIFVSLGIMFFDFTEPAELHENLSDDAGRRLQDNITGLEAMLNPNMEELAQIDNETLEVILKTDRNDETSPTSRMCHSVYCPVFYN